MHPVKQMSGSTFHHQAKAGAQAHWGLTEKGVAGRSRLRLLDTWVGSKAPPTPHSGASVQQADMVPRRTKTWTAFGLQAPWLNLGLCLSPGWGFQFPSLRPENQE